MSKNRFSIQNVYISSFLCIIIGTILFFNSKSILWSSASVTIFIAGIILIIIGISLQIYNITDIKNIDRWTPDPNFLPDAGGPIYRIDTTLVHPIRTSILCGKCKHIEWIDGSKPTSYSCIKCGILLWHNDEEE